MLRSQDRVMLKISYVPHELLSREQHGYLLTAMGLPTYDTLLTLRVFVRRRIISHFYIKDTTMLR